MKNYIANLALLLALATQAWGEGRNYHPRTIAQITAENPVDWKHPLTHVEVAGWVTYVAQEGDGDLHVRLCDDPNVAGMNVKRCIVAEVIPTLVPKGYFKPKRGQQIVVRGIYRYDGENPGHHWHEVHPVEWMASYDDPPPGTAITF